MVDMLKYKVYRNNELVGAFVRESDARVFVDAIKTWDEYTIYHMGKCIYTTDEEC